MQSHDSQKDIVTLAKPCTCTHMYTNRNIDMDMYVHLYIYIYIHIDLYTHSWRSRGYVSIADVLKSFMPWLLRREVQDLVPPSKPFPFPKGRGFGKDGKMTLSCC